MYYSFAVAFALLSYLALGYGTAGTTLQNTIDLKRLENICKDGLKSNDLGTLYYTVKGLKQLNPNTFDKLDICPTFKTIKYDSKNLEQVFYLTNAASLSGCVNSLSPDVMNVATQTLDKKDATVQDLYYAVFTLKAIGKGQTVNKDEALKNLITLLKKDDSAVNYGYVFTLCEHIGCESWTTSNAENIMLTADESDGKALFFEGGLPVTSLILSSVIRSYRSQKKASPLSEAERAKFAEYLVSRRSVTTPRGAALLIEAALALADDAPSPVVISIKGKKYVTQEQDTVEVSISDILGRPVRNLKPDDVIAQSGTRLTDDVVVLSKQSLTQKPNEPTTFVLNLSKIKSQYGVYKIVLSAGSASASANIAVLGDIQVSSVEIGVGDVDGTTSPKVTTVSYPNKLGEVLQADHLQKLSLKFFVRDKQNKPVLVQQAFVRIASDQDEAIFVAEPDNTKAYKVDLSVSSISKHLSASEPGFSVTLYVGDSAAARPLAWRLADMHLNFGNIVATTAAKSLPPRAALAEISHSFRAPSARPARLVSDVFALLSGAPLLLLLALWAALGANLRNMPLAPSALLFHLGLGGSLSLYGVLWLQLSMFETVRYLLPLALLTFLSGHRLLRRLADKGASK